MDKKGIFFGELPPRTIHGASLSNKINVDILKRIYEMDFIEEFSDLKYHNKFSLSKIINFLSPLIYSWSCFKRKKYDFYYGVIYLSFLGLLKNILITIPFKIFNPKAFLVLHFHRSDLESCLSNFFNLILFKTLNIFVSKYIVLSKKQISEVRKYTSKEIYLLYNTIEENELKYESNIKVKQNPIKLLFLSNFIKQKGFFDLLEAQKQINNFYPNLFELNCYGSFSNNCENELNLEELKKSNINIFDKVYGKQKNLILNETDLIVLPSYNEGLPLILLEALFLGKPIIISNVGYIEEVLGKNYPLYCKSGDINSIINSLIYFKQNINHQELSSFMKNIYKKFSLKEHESRLLEIFKK